MLREAPVDRNELNCSVEVNARLANNTTPNTAKTLMLPAFDLRRNDRRRIHEYLYIATPVIPSGPDAYETRVRRPRVANRTPNRRQRRRCGGAIDSLMIFLQGGLS
jgi:hypothetical protein